MPTPRALFPGLQRWQKKFKKDAEKNSEPSITFTATPKQVEWINAVVSGLYSFLAIGGGIRGTKSFACISATIILCRIFPRSRWAIVRKDLPTIRRNVIPTMEKLRLMSGGFVGPLHQGTWTYTCANGSEILLFAEQFAQDPELERWKGLEVNGFDLEEANELSEKSANKAIERAGSYIIPATAEDPTPRQPPPIVMANFNPCSNWPRRWWYQPWKAGSITAPYYFLPSTIADNPYASDEYKASLRFLPPEEYKRFVLGEWDFTDDPDQLIKSEWIWNALNVEPAFGVNRLGGDVARYGDDFSTVAVVSGNALVTLHEYKHLSTDRFGDVILIACADRHYPVPDDNTIIDTVGLGAGTYDYVKRQGMKRVKEFISGATAVPRAGSFFRFANLRSQAWWEFRERLRNGLFCFFLRDGKGEVIPIPEKLVGDLATPRYTIKSDKVISVESKDDIKARLGRSTDYGDAVVMAAFEFPHGALQPGFM